LSRSLNPQTRNFRLMGHRLPRCGVCTVRRSPRPFSPLVSHLCVRIVDMQLVVGSLPYAQPPLEECAMLEIGFSAYILMACVVC